MVAGMGTWDAGIGRDSGRQASSVGAEHGRRRGGWLAATLGIVAGAYLLIVALVLVATRGEFTYTIDDSYIHLALAEQISHGHYGIGAVEFSSPSSSPLWPVLLAVTARLPFAEWMPLVYGLAATLGSTVLLWTILGRAESRPHLRLLLTVGLVYGLNLLGVAFTGMEHSLQVLLSLLAGYGVVRVLEDGVLPGWLPLVLVVGPLVRYENTAVSAAVAAVIFLAGRRRVAIAATGAWVAALAAFSGFLMLQGLDALPSSILAKSVYQRTDSLGAALHHQMTAAWNEPAFVAVFLVLLADVVVKRRWGRLHSFVAALWGAQLLAGGFDGLTRYDLYLYATVVAPLVVLLKGWQLRHGPERGLLMMQRAVALTVTVTIGVAVLSNGRATLSTPAASRDIWSQQAQTAEFVRAYWKHPIAANDVGLVALRGGQPMLDLSGVANQRARRARMNDEEGWLRELVDAADVHLVAVYPAWFPGEVPDEWIRVGELTSTVRRVSSWSSQVVFYATDVGAAADACDALSAFSTQVPGQTVVTTHCASAVGAAQA